MERESPQSGFRFADPYQRDVYERLQRHVSDGAAAFWQDACALMSAESSLPTTSHLVGHLLREIESALRDVLVEPSKEHLGLRSNQERHKAEVTAVLQGLSIPADHPAAKFWLMLADPESAETLARYAHRSGLMRPRPVDQDFRELFGEVASFLRYVLQRFEDNWLKVFTKVLDGILAHDSPTTQDIKTLKDGIPQNPVALGYFFNQLNSAKWFEPLRDAGFFSIVPDPVAEGDLLRFPPWPPGPYLVRMASVDPAAVASVISDLPETENYVVHWHLLDAALAMPASCAASIVGQVKGCVGGRYSLGVGAKVLKLVERLVEGGEVNAALSIAEALLDLSGDDEHKKRAIKGYGSYARHEYEEALRAFAPMLTKAAGVRWVRLLTRFLTDAIRLDREGETESREDGSSFWCRAIEQDEDPSHGLKVLLLAALRQAAEAVMREKPAEAAQVFEVVRGGPYKVFDRIEIHLLRLFPQGRENRIREILGSRGAYEKRSHEYRMLLVAHFRHLPEHLQRQYLQWVGEKPDVEKAKARWKEEWDRDVDGKEILAGWEQGQLHRLAGLEEWLPPEWQARYRELVAKHYVPASPDHVVPRATASFVGPETPKSAEDLAAMPVGELLGFLREWRPESSHLGEPSPEGLGQTLEQVVAKSPGRFADAAEFLEDLPPTYVRHILSGLRTACGSGARFDWCRVLALCKWVMLQPVAFDQDNDHLTADKGWNWTQGEVARLVQAGLSPDNAEVPFARRKDLWDCIAPLTDSPDPTQDRETEEMTKYGREPCELSINSVRGGGMELVIRYALWVRRHLEAGPDAKKRIAEGFAAMPEVREVLDKHLDVEADPSLAIRSVYGQWFPWLTMLDASWAGEKAERVFPLDEQYARFLAAAWGTYIVMNRPWDSVYRILWAQYAAAVRSLAQPKEDVGHLGNPDMSLTEHLIVLRARGVITDTDTVWQAFLGVAREDVRRRAITFVADIFQENEQIPQAHADFLRSFVEARLNAAENVAKQGEEAAEWRWFGWFFGAKSLDDDWLLAQLERVLVITRGVVEHDFHIFERLPSIAQKHPQRAVRCLRAVVEANAQGWAVAGHEKEIGQVIRAALGAGEVGARQAARDFVNYLASRGWLQFRDLLPES